MVKAFKRKYNLDPIPADEILTLAEQLAEQGRKSVVDLKNYKEICEGLANE
jgi:hypothetical protein